MVGATIMAPSLGPSWVAMVEVSFMLFIMARALDMLHRGMDRCKANTSDREMAKVISSKGVRGGTIPINSREELSTMALVLLWFKVEAWLVLHLQMVHLGNNKINHQEVYNLTAPWSLVVGLLLIMVVEV